MKLLFTYRMWEDSATREETIEAKSIREAITIADGLLKQLELSPLGAWSTKLNDRLNPDGWYAEYKQWLGTSKDWWLVTARLRDAKCIHSWSLTESDKGDKYIEECALCGKKRTLKPALYFIGDIQWICKNSER